MCVSVCETRADKVLRQSVSRKLEHSGFSVQRGLWWTAWTELLLNDIPLQQFPTLNRESSFLSFLWL